MNPSVFFQVLPQPLIQCPARLEELQVGARHLEGTKSEPWTHLDGACDMGMDVE